MENGSPNRELAISAAPGLYYKSPVKYSYLSNYLDDNAEIAADSLSKS